MCLFLCLLAWLRTVGLNLMALGYMQRQYYWVYNPCRAIRLGAVPRLKTQNMLQHQWGRIYDECRAIRWDLMNLQRQLNKWLMFPTWKIFVNKHIDDTFQYNSKYNKHNTFFLWSKVRQVGQKRLKSSYKWRSFRTVRAWLTWCKTLFGKDVISRSKWKILRLIIK